MYFSNIEYTVKYVDPSKATNGDGSSVQDAMNQLPTTDEGYVENTCYLIRRTAEGAAVTIPAITCSRKNLLFVGMPLSSDWLYEFVPDIAKDAWTADAFEYANMKSTVSSGYFFMPNVNNLHLFRIYLYRSNLTPQQYIFYTEKDDYTTQFSFQHCKFGALGVNLDQAAYTAAVTANYSAMWVYANTLKVFNMNDCMVNFAFPTGSAFGFYVNYTQFLDIHDVTVNNVFQSTGSNNYPFYFYRGNDSRPLTAYLENITMNIKFNNGYSYVPQLLYLTQAEMLRIKNINIGITGNLGSVQATNLILYRYIVYLSSARQYEIDTFNCGLPGVWNVDNSGACLCCESFFTGSRTPGNIKTVKNIHISMEEVSGIDTAKGQYYDRVKNTSFNYYAVFRFSCGNYDDSRIVTPAILENITVYNNRGVAAYLYSCQIRGAVFHGAVKMDGVIGDIDLITSHYPGYAIFATRYSTVRVQRVEVNLHNEAAPPAEDPVIYNNQTDNYFIFVDFCNARLRPNVSQNVSNSNDPAAICANEVEAQHFSQKSVNYIVDTWTTYRAGGAPASLRLSNNAYNSTYEMFLGKEPFGGSKLNPVETGKHYLIVYVAHKGFANAEDLGSKCVIQLSVPQGNGNFKRYFSNTHGVWMPDTNSEWVGDVGLTRIMLVMPVDIVTTGEQLDLKIKYSWYSSAGFLYIDPAFVLYPASEVPVNAGGVGEEGQ